MKPLVSAKSLALLTKQGGLMKKFIILYNGPATPPERMSPEKTQEIMGKWKTWMEKVGNGMVDMGQPMANGQSVVDDGSFSQTLELSGYSIIQAETMDQALELVKDHPFLSDQTGKFSVEVFELLPVPDM